MSDNLIEQVIPRSEANGRADNVKGVVLNYSALPLVGNNIDDVYFTLEGQGVWGINRKPSDYYIWTGSDWRGTYNKLTSVTGLTFSGAEQVLSASTGAIIQTALDTKVAGPISATDNNIATFSGTTGKLIKDSGIPIGNITPVTLNADTPTQNGLSLVGQVLQAKLVTTITHGLMAFADKLKLDGVASGATANQTDAFLLARANHTGTQLANTISNFQATVSANTTLTGHISNTSNPHGTTITQAIAADAGTNITTAELETLSNGSNADSLHKHSIIGNAAQTTFAETQAANIFRVITASVVRFTISALGNLNLSAYLQNIRNDITVADQKVLTTNNAGDVLLRRVLPYSKSLSNSVGGINQTTTLTNYITLNFTISEAGEYPIDYSYVWSLNDINEDFIGAVILDTVPPSAEDTLVLHQEEPKDSGGVGVLLPNLNGGAAINSGTSQRQLAAGFAVRTLAVGDYSVRIDIAATVINLEAAIYQGNLRVGHKTNV